MDDMSSHVSLDVKKVTPLWPETRDGLHYAPRAVSCLTQKDLSTKLRLSLYCCIDEIQISIKKQLELKNLFGNRERCKNGFVWRWSPQWRERRTNAIIILITDMLSAERLNLGVSATKLFLVAGIADATALAGGHNDNNATIAKIKVSMLWKLKDREQYGRSRSDVSSYGKKDLKSGWINYWCSPRVTLIRDAAIRASSNTQKATQER